MKKIAVMGNIEHGKTTLISAIGSVFGAEVKNLSNSESDIMRTETKVNFGGTDYLFFDYPSDYDYVQNLDGSEDGVVLVVSGADGAMGGTEKAMDLCKNLGIENIVVFSSKCDLVEDEEFIEMMEMDIKYCFCEREMNDNVPFIRGSAKMVLEGHSGWICYIKDLVKAVAETV